MSRRTIDFDTVRGLGLALSGVEEGTAYGAPCLRVGRTMFACMAVNKSAEPGTLVVRIDREQRNEMIAADPVTYYVTDHYLNYPSVLVRLSRVDREALKDLLTMAWRDASESARKRAVARRRSVVNPRRG